MQVQEENKSDYDIIKNIYVDINKKGFIILTIFISSLITLFLDFQLDFKLYVYLLVLIIIFFLSKLIITKSFIKRFKRKAILLDAENLNFFNDTLRISDSDVIISCEIKNCRIVLKDDYLFLRTPSIIMDKQITRKLFVVKANSIELKQKYSSIIEPYLQKNKIKFKILTSIYIALSILSIAWKIDLYVLNKFYYDKGLEWEVLKIEKNESTIFQIDTTSKGYVGLKNNFTNDTSSFWSSNRFFHFRHEPFLGVRLLYASGESGRSEENGPFSDMNVLGLYDELYESDTLKLIKKEFKIICIHNK